MKTTLDIADPLFEEAKALAAREGVTLRSLVEQGLREVIRQRAVRKRPFKLKNASVKGKGWVDPALLTGDWRILREQANERGRP